MSVCGRKRLFLDSSPASVSYKKLRRCSPPALCFEAKAEIANDGEAAAAAVPDQQHPSAGTQNLPVDGAERADFFIRELASCTTQESAQNLHKENSMLKEQMQALVQQNTVLKRAVVIQHERQKESEDKNNELQHLKQSVSQYQEQLRTLELKNYALTMHLKQAQQSNPIPGSFHPDVF
ncbi:hypothetical protein COLO4_25940 [Corchorus olitorius]|uniref:Uncharacterized protein n=1 Tax=Corchorus olitorius TaxID=93759 RepID=A0A1R3HZF1_9ROSI|nr:hypothetical protein COLO4_25940 [Corchorus olitorius]